MITVSEAYKRGRGVLKQCGIGSAALDTMLLLERATGLSRTELVTRDTKQLSLSETTLFESILSERAAHKPIQYILNTCEFMSLDFYVDERVLIPRPDSEILAEAVITYAKLLPGNIRILEIGTGSGCIAISIAKYAKNTHITAIDINQGALSVAHLNAEKNGNEQLQYI